MVSQRGIYNRFKMSVKETNISSTEGIVDSVVEKMNSDLYNIRQISNAANYNIIQQYDVSSQEFNNQFSLLYETNSDKIQSLVLFFKTSFAKYIYGWNIQV